MDDKGWISIKDENHLPPIGTDVLVCIKPHADNNYRKVSMSRFFLKAIVY